MKIFPDFRSIVPHFGSQDEAFEEFCCQHARHATGTPVGSEFIRYRGAGGDGGVECVWRLPGGEEWGLQAKYIFDLTKALAKVDESLLTALTIHPALSRYTVCLPFDLSGPTGRKTRAGVPVVSQREQFDGWRKAREQEARDKGTELQISLETPSSLLDGLLGFDPEGGRLRFWFDASAFGDRWFEKHLQEAKESAKPRYTPELRVEVPVAQAFEALCLTDKWFASLLDRRKELRELCSDWASSVANSREGGWDTPFPDDLRPDGQAATALIEDVYSKLDLLAAHHHVHLRPALAVAAKKALANFRQIKALLARQIDERHGEGASESASFRQHQAEYQVSFPTANLDRAAKLIALLEKLQEWAESPFAMAAGQDEILLTGIAGTGKTHSICDIGDLRAERSLLTVILFGERFSGAAEPWTQIRQQLGLADGIGRDEMLEALDAAGEATGHPLLLCVDGLNETKPRGYWQPHLASFVAHLRRYPNIKLCLSCRSTYIPLVMPEGHGWYAVEHEGFKGMEFDACRAFFFHYELQMPTTPILQIEFSNPLFLRLVCDAARSGGHASLPTGWRGIYSAISAFLKAKNDAHARQHGILPSYRVPERGLLAFIAASKAFGRAALPFDLASQALQTAVPAGLVAEPLLDWLVKEGLLILDAEPDESGSMAEYVRVAFERLGDHLLASKYLEAADAEAAASVFGNDGVLSFAVENAATVSEHQGLLEALAVQLPERFGIELPDCAGQAIPEEVRKLLLEVTTRSLLWRDPGLITDATMETLWRALSTSGLASAAFDALIEVAAQPSPVDAFSLHRVLASKRMPDRDAFWCGYLHENYERKGPVEKLIRAALGMDVSTVSEEVCERWATALLWFCAAADRRVRDHATKAVVRLTERQPALWARLIDRFASVDDEYVVERCLEAAYGVLLRTRNPDTERDVASSAFEAVFREPLRFQNAVIRDSARSILDLAACDSALPEGVRQEDYLPPYASEWPLQVPTEDEMKPYKEDRSLPKLYASCTFDDFSRYSLSRLSSYRHVLSEKDMGYWIFRHVLDIGYTAARFGDYDGYMLYKFGGGRGRPGWAERIGKKYQWIALARLAARLADNAQPEPNRWDPELQGTPLTYMRGRTIDPSLLAPKNVEPRSGASWWQPAAYGFDHGPADDATWVADGSDIPNSELLVKAIDPDGREWVVLETHCEWTQRPKGEEREDSWDGRRNLWMQVRSYLVAEEDFDRCWRWIKRQQFMGRWMPEGPSFHEGHVGEYPWGTPFTLYPDSWHSQGGEREGQMPCDMAPTCATLSSHHEEDAYQTESVNVHLPTRLFFEDGGLKWDGGGGFIGDDEQKRFLDPSVGNSERPALLACPEFLQRFLRERKLRIVWTVLSEKLAMGDKDLPRLEFSRAHSLDGDRIISSKPVLQVK